MSLNEQIAVLDGLAALDPNDGRIGQTRARVDQYGRSIGPGVLMRTNVIDPSGGANLTGGSNWAPRMPLMPSSIGLAGFGALPGMLPPRIGVIDPSGGANFTGGSNWSARMPLLPSNAGLAGGEYGRAGLGQGDYGRAGLGRFAGGLSDADLLTAAETVAQQQMLDQSDGRVGQYRAQPTQYADQIARGVLRRRDVLDPSEGANYSGGSNWTARMPLTPSNAGLAGLDAAADSKLGIAGPLKKQIGANVVADIKKKLLGIERIWNSASAAQKNQLFAQYRASVGTLLQHLGAVRAMRMKALAVKRAGGVPGQRRAA